MSVLGGLQRAPHHQLGIDRSSVVVRSSARPHGFSCSVQGLPMSMSAGFEHHATVLDTHHQIFPHYMQKQIQEIINFAMGPFSIASNILGEFNFVIGGSRFVMLLCLALFLWSTANFPLKIAGNCLAQQ